MPLPPPNRNPLSWLIVAFCGAGVGRLVSADTITRPLRRRVFVDLLGLRWFGGGPDAEIAPDVDIDDVVAPGVHPFTRSSVSNGVVVEAPSWRRAAIVEGLSCPSCSGFWATFAAHLVFDRRVWRPDWWVAQFSMWAAAGVIVRKG